MSPDTVWPAHRAAPHRLIFSSHAPVARRLTPSRAALHLRRALLPARPVQFIRAQAFPALHRPAFQDSTLEVRRGGPSVGSADRACCPAFPRFVLEVRRGGSRAGLTASARTGEKINAVPRAASADSQRGQPRTVRRGTAPHASTTTTLTDALDAYAIWSFSIRQILYCGRWAKVARSQRRRPLHLLHLSRLRIGPMSSSYSRMIGAGAMSRCTTLF